MTESSIASCSVNRIKKNEKIAFGFLQGTAIITTILLITIVGGVLANGTGHLSMEFLTRDPENMGKDGGVFSIIITTAYLVLISLVIAAPIGICAAIYLTEFARKGKIVRLIRFGTEALAGIPSIIFGLFGYAFFVVFLKFRYSMVSGGLTLTLMILPTIIRTVEESIKMVPRSQGRQPCIGRN